MKYVHHCKGTSLLFGSNQKDITVIAEYLRTPGSMFNGLWIKLQQFFY